MTCSFILRRCPHGLSLLRKTILRGLMFYSVTPNTPSGLESIPNNGETLGGGSKRGEFGWRSSSWVQSMAVFQTCRIKCQTFFFLPVCWKIKHFVEGYRRLWHGIRDKASFFLPECTHCHCQAWNNCLIIFKLHAVNNWCFASIWSDWFAAKKNWSKDPELFKCSPR